ncbi:3-dehydroquinate dehydratase [Corynebacterium faecale]|uniref:type II 3-dehydroquinate dehydratase n=1 Tax=Corynebacterium faecale TaxID=1758466 RepID=UPI0025B379E4|nr:type II 3-dehydroquinate dehydratase [Corynebacterium faecale]WJY91210.1 3-dehydroquinate dehydratase [Corynebacterium faecale]
MSGRILLLNGPNLNMLGLREPEIYGEATLDDVVALTREQARAHGCTIDAVQSNHEGDLIDALHRARGTHIGCVLNPGGLTHTSVALLDAVKASELSTVEVHISNPHAREAFRHHSYISLAARAVIAGAGIQGYAFAVDILAADHVSRKISN